MGEVFAGRYELVDPLGEGGAGVVWRVWDRKHSRYCAAKVLRQVDASSLLRFMREQSLRLQHQHVLAPTGWAGEDDKVLFTMPIVDGGSTSTLVSDFGPLPQRLVAVLLDQLLAALEAIHAEGIVHRDVKPANLLLDATGDEMPRLWLGDFGIAAGEDAPRLTQGPYAMGTPGYTAPECLHQGWQPDARADLYAAAMSALELLTGQRPEPDADVRAALASAERTEPVSAEFIEVLAWLGHPRIAERFPSAAAARAALSETGLLRAASAAEVLGEVEVFNHIPELPPGWTPHGPASGEEPQEHDGDPAASYPPTRDFAAVINPAAAEQQATEVIPTGSGATSAMPAASPDPGGSVPQPATEDQPAGGSGVPAGPQPGPGLSQSSRKKPRRGQGIAIAALLLGAGLVLLALALWLAGN